MKKIASILAVMTIASFIACNESSGPSTETGYVDPGLGSTKTVNANKSYDIATEPLCGPSASCHSIIYVGTLNNTSYVGIAVDNFNSTPANRFSFKMYWPATSIPQGNNLTINSCNIKIIDNSTSYELLNTTINNVDINYNSSNNTYEIEFNSLINVSGININALDFIHAYKYPE